MIALVVSRKGGSAEAVRAFGEEASELAIIHADEDPAAAVSRLSDVDHVIALSPDAATLAERLQAHFGVRYPTGEGPSQLRTDPGVQRAALGELGREPTTDADGYYLVETVSREGAHVTCGAFQCRVDMLFGKRVMRHRVSVPDRTENSERIEPLARDGLDAIGLKNGAACIEIEESSAGLHIVGILPSIGAIPVPIDAAFAAFGVSHQHILSESVLRPEEFARRQNRPPMRSRTTLGVAPLRLLGRAKVDGFKGLSILRRLAGYHSLVDLAAPGAALGEGSVAGIVCFVLPDRASVEFSLKVAHEMEDSWTMFSADQQFVDLSRFVL